MSTSTEAAAPALLPLGLVEEHLDAVGTLWLQRRGLSMSLSARARDVAKVDARLAAHVRALVLFQGEAVREAELRLWTPIGWRRFAACRVLLELSPGSLRGGDGRLRVRQRTRDFGLLDALRHGPAWVGGFVEASEPVLVDAASFHAPLPEALLREALEAGGRARRAALLAAARHAQTATLGGEAATEGLSDADGATRLVAAYALGLADPPAFLGRATRALGADPLEAGVDPLVVALFAGAEAAPLLLRVVRACPTDEAVHALGLAGDAAALPLLAELCEDGSPSLRLAAAHALRCLTAERIVAPPKAGAFESGRHGAPEVDLGALRAWLARRPSLEGSPVHLGLRLDDPAIEAADLPTSFAFLRALRDPEGGALRYEIPDALLPDEGYGALSLGPDHLFSSRRALPS